MSTQETEIEVPLRAQIRLDKETIQTLLDLLNPLHGSLDRQTYDEQLRAGFDLPGDAEHTVTITARQERDLMQAVLILENRLRALDQENG